MVKILSLFPSLGPVYLARRRVARDARPASKQAGEQANSAPAMLGGRKHLLLRSLEHPLARPAAGPLEDQTSVGQKFLRPQSAFALSGPYFISADSNGIVCENLPAQILQTPRLLGWGPARERARLLWRPNSPGRPGAGLVAAKTNTALSVGNQNNGAGGHCARHAALSALMGRSGVGARAALRLANLSCGAAPSANLSVGRRQTGEPRLGGPRPFARSFATIIMHARS